MRRQFPSVDACLQVGKTLSNSKCRVPVGLVLEALGISMEEFKDELLEASRAQCIHQIKFSGGDSPHFLVNPAAMVWDYGSSGTSHRLRCRRLEEELLPLVQSRLSWVERTRVQQIDAVFALGEKLVQHGGLVVPLMSRNLCFVYLA